MKHLTRPAIMPVLLLVALLLLAAPRPALAVLEPSADFYVNDYAGVLSADTEAEIMATAPALASATGAQIVVLTVAGLEGLAPHDFAYAVATAWGIGAKEKDNGLLILLAPTEGQIWLEVGYGLEGALNDAKVGRYIDTYAMDYYREGDFDTGTLELYKALLSQIMVEYGLEALPGYEPLRESSSSGLLTIVVALLIIWLFIRRNRRPYRRGGPPFFGGGHGGGFGGGFGGGGYRGGGGGFGGGSGGGFRGGGGGFGGGGAGRSFK